MAEINGETGERKPQTTAFENLFGVCGLKESRCGEDMISKVAHLFGAGEETPDDSNGGTCEEVADQVKAASLSEDSPLAADPEHFDTDLESNESNNYTDITHTMVGTEESAPESPKSKTTDHKSHKSPITSPEKNPKKKKGKKKGHSQSPTKKEFKNKILSHTTKKVDQDDENYKQEIHAGEISPFGSEKSDIEEKEETEDDDDVDAMLANLEIPDFDMSLELDDNQVQQETNEIDDVPLENVNWQERISREEVFSKRYKPKQSEIRELEVMADSLGLSKSSDFLSAIGLAGKMTENIRNLFSGEHSILLSVIPVMCDKHKCDLLILTGGFVLKYQSSVNFFNPLEKRYETCLLWNEVDFIERDNPFEITIQVADSSTKYDISSVDGGEPLNTVLQRLEHVIIAHELFLSRSDRTEILGWQYLRVRKPAFTAAVMNDPRILAGKHQAVSRLINELDSYNKQAPLHYAVLQEECNIELIQGLLNAGADPNLEDGDGRSAMYYGK